MPSPNSAGDFSGRRDAIVRTGGNSDFTISFANAARLQQGVKVE